MECKEDSIGCTLQEAKSFFEKFNLGFKVFDVYSNLSEEHVPEKRNT